jgi:hypothetical protein
MESISGLFGWAVGILVGVIAPLYAIANLRRHPERSRRAVAIYAGVAIWGVLTTAVGSLATRGSAPSWLVMGNVLAAVALGYVVASGVWNGRGWGLLLVIAAGAGTALLALVLLLSGPGVGDPT